MICWNYFGYKQICSGFFCLQLFDLLYISVTVVGGGDRQTCGKLNMHFPLPGCVGFPPSQPAPAFTKAEPIESSLKQSSPEVWSLCSILPSACTKMLCLLYAWKFCHCVNNNNMCTHLLYNSVWLNGLVVSTLGIRARWPRFEFWVTPLFHWVASLGMLFTHIASPVSQLQETWVLKGVFGAWVVMVIKCTRLS